MRTERAALFLLLVIVVIIAVLGWIRPVRSVVDGYTHERDSLLVVIEAQERVALAALREANAWRMTADSLRARREDPAVIVVRTERELEALGVNDAALDSVQTVLMSKP